MNIQSKSKLPNQGNPLASDIVPSLGTEISSDASNSKIGELIRLFPAIADFKQTVVPLCHAQKAFGFSRTGFWRFRNRHGIEVLSGWRVNITDIIAGFEAERHGQRRSA